METSSYKKGGSVDPICNCEWGFIIFYSLKKSKIKAEGNRDGKGLKSPFAVGLHNTMMGSCNRYTWGEEDCSIKKWDFKRVKWNNTCGWSAFTYFWGGC